MEKEFLFKIHKSYRWVVSICDKNLFGRKLEDEEKQLDLSGKFFDGEEVGIDELAGLIEQCMYEDSTFYIVGEKSIEFVKKINLINSGGIKYIDKVPFALILL